MRIWVITLAFGSSLLACTGGGSGGSNGSGMGGSGGSFGGSVNSGGSVSGTGGAMMTGNGGATMTGAGGATGALQQLSVQLIGNGQGTVTSAPAGITCSNTGGAGPCTGSFSSGTSVALTAAPASNAVFSGWSSACTGSGPCAVTLDASKTVAASFALADLLKVTVAGDGAGSVVSNPAGIDCSSSASQPCTYGFPDSVGNQVSLTVMPAAGSSFAGWSFGGCNASPYAHTCPVPLNTNASGTSITVWFSAWNAQQPFPSAVSAAASLNGTYVVVGEGGALLTSLDGAAWTGHPLASRAALRGIAADGTKLVAVGDEGTILVSSDANSWAAATSGTSRALSSVAFGAGTFVAVGAGGSIVTSTDASTFTVLTPLTSYDLLAVTYGGGQFIAVGYGGTILTSSDGSSWNARTSPTTQFLAGVTFGGNQYVAVGSAGALATSPDGIVWTARSNFTTSTLRSVAAISGTPAYVAAGDATGSGGALIFTSDDGVAWAAHGTGAFQEQFTGVANLGGSWLALGNGGSIYRSSNGVAWSPVLSPGGRGPIGTHDGTLLGALAFGNGTYVAAGNYGAVFTSTDGRTWMSRAADRVGISNTSVVFGGGLFVMTQSAQNSWRVLSSPDGATWTQRGSGATGNLAGVAYGGASTGFVAAGWVNGGPGFSGVIVTSPDGTSWTPRAGADLPSQLTNIAYGANLFVMTGGGGAIYTSPDGMTVTPQASPTADFLGALTYGNGVFVAIDTQNGGQSAVVSSDGIAWRKIDVSFSLGGALAFGNGGFLSSGLATSTDGVNWVKPAGLPETAPLINSGIFMSAIYGASGWVGGGLFETFAFHP